MLPLHSLHQGIYSVTMITVKLIDILGYIVGTPLIPEPLPRVVVWGECFYLSGEADVTKRPSNPTYHEVSGFVVADTTESSKRLRLI